MDYLFTTIVHYTTTMRLKVNKRLLYPLFSAVVLIVGTYVAIQYATGALRVSKDGIIQGSGLLSATSDPKGAELWIDGRLVSATDDTLYLEPKTYSVEIIKEGFSPWQKNIAVMPEVVAQANARLFPIASSLTPLTFSGAANLLPSPDGQKLLYYTASQSATQKNGLYVLDLASSTFPLQQRGPRQILQDDPRYDLKNAAIIWSPDSSEILLMTEQKEVLLNPDQLRSLDQLPDVSLRKRQILSQWEEEIYLRERQYLITFPPEIIRIATESAKNVYFSPSKKMLLYTATTSAMLADELIPAVPGASTQTQVRTLKPGYIYVYDREEDRNFELGPEPSAEAEAKYLLATDLYNREPKSFAASPSAFTRLQATDSATLASNFRRYHSPLFANTFQWFPDSKHLLFVADNTVRIVEHEGTNNTSLYAGPFDNTFLYPWPDGNRVLITTTFSPTMAPNLYAIELR